MAKKRKQLDPVDKLIAEAQQARTPMPSDEGVAALRRVFAHNDNAAASERVSIARVLEMLETHYKWKGHIRSLNSVCRRLGRKSFASAS